ncbi:MAG: 16S rRNA (cytosine(1402)-N(4))-methyltransferase RsmH [Bacteroidota bacterium]
MIYHQPVLPEASVKGLNIHPDGIYVDVTYGGGGHSARILEKLKNGKLIAFDQDIDAGQNVLEDERLIFLNENFRHLKTMLKMLKAYPVDGILADLGISSWQINKPERGFSTRFNGPLDMRMDRNQLLTAARVVNEYEHEKLMNIFRNYGEIKNAYKVAAQIITERNKKEIKTTEDLKNALLSIAPKMKENKFFAQVFQALRIEVNCELQALQDLLEQSLEMLKIGGRMVFISYHSLEDRLVKNFMKTGKFTGEVEKDLFGNDLSPVKPVGKLIVPDQKEVLDNPRSRSAKLRIAEKIK